MRLRGPAIGFPSTNTVGLPERIVPRRFRSEMESPVAKAGNRPIRTDRRFQQASPEALPMEQGI
jgi:hypothetical protein